MRCSLLGAGSWHKLYARSATFKPNYLVLLLDFLQRRLHGKLLHKHTSVDVTTTVAYTT